MKKLDAFPTAQPVSQKPLPLPPETATAVPVANLPPPPPAPVPAPLRSVLAGRLGQVVTRAQPKLTAEQADILTTAPTVPILVVEAGAGVGKTFVLAKLATTLGGRGQYTARSAKLVADSAKKFPQSCPANTVHSLAFRAEGKRFAHRLKGRRVRSAEIGRMLGIEPITVPTADGKEKVLQVGQLASFTLAAVRRFLVSADREVAEQHFPQMPGLDQPGSYDVQNSVRATLLPHARQAWSDLSDPKGTLPCFTHDCYVKVWELNKPIIAADYVLLDEAQDMSPVMLSVLGKQVALGTRVILVGDSAQQIFDWAGAVNALAAFPEAPRRLLSQSFRFGQAIALVANAVLGHLRDKSPLVMKGCEAIQSSVGVLSRPSAILCRTNACAISHFLQAIKDGRRPFLVGKQDDVVSFCRAAEDLQQLRGTEHPELSCFASWVEVQEYVKTDEGADLKLMAKIVDDFGAKTIITAIDQMVQERDADLVIGTAHKSKGLEYPTVKLASDFPTLDKMGDPELRLLYVACTRAKEILDVSECPPFCGGKRKASEGFNGEGGECPTIDISAARRFVPQQLQEPAATPTDLFGDPLPATPAAPETASTARPTGPPADNTFTKGRNGDWLVRGPRGQSGRVEVRLKSGKRAWKTIEKLVWEDAVQGVALYAVKNERS